MAVWCCATWDSFSSTRMDFARMDLAQMIGGCQPHNARSDNQDIAFFHDRTILPGRRAMSTPYRNEIDMSDLWFYASAIAKPIRHT